MKLYWHIGPHKTGTTSLQLALSAHAARGRDSYYYPPVGDFGPGHAILAWQLLGMNGRERSPDVIRDEIAKAKAQGYSAMVLSSEEFSRAVADPDSFGALARVCEEIECELILTLRPLTERLYPELQENVKQGEKVLFGALHDLLAVCANRPGMRPDFLPAAILGSGATTTSVIMVDPADPQKLFAAISTILGETIAPARSTLGNASYPFLKAAWLEAINRYAKSNPPEARAAVDVAFRHAARKLKSLDQTPYPPIPPVLQKYLDSVWRLQLEYLRALEQTGRIRFV